LEGAAKIISNSENASNCPDERSDGDERH